VSLEEKANSSPLSRKGSLQKELKRQKQGPGLEAGGSSRNTRERERGGDVPQTASNSFKALLV